MTTTVDRLTLSDIDVDYTYQRETDPVYVRSLVAKFDPDAVGALSVGLRPDGTMWVVDGQHRLKALVELGHSVWECSVFHSSGPEHEARIFKRMNKDRKAVNAVTVFHAEVVERDATACGILAAVESAGYSIARKKSWPHIQSVSELRKVWKLGGEDLTTRVLQVIRDAWPREKDALQGCIVGGLALVLNATGTHQGRLLNVVSKLSPVFIVRESDAYASYSGQRAKKVAGVILEHYNKRLKHKVQA